MIRIEKTAVSGWQAAIRGMRNPMNSWERSDSYETHIEDAETQEIAPFEFFVGENDLDLMKRLAKAGTEHAKFMRYINVTVDIVAPLYMYKEMDCYRAGVEHNSCSTMHKIQSKEFVKDDFSVERMTGKEAERALCSVINALNRARDAYLSNHRKEDWYTMIQLLPSSYNQRRTYQFTYQALAAIYRQRKGHRLDEWQTFREWIESLPYSEIITGGHEDA